MSTVAKPASANDGGFFSSIAESFQSGISRIATDVLPVWAANQLQVQMQDYLKTPTFNPAAAEPRIADGMQSTAGPIQTAVSDPNIKKTGLLFDNVNVSGTALFALVGAVVIGIIAARS